MVPMFPLKNPGPRQIKSKKMTAVLAGERGAEFAPCLAGRKILGETPAQGFRPKTGQGEELSFAVVPTAPNPLNPLALPGILRRLKKESGDRKKYMARQNCPGMGA